MPSDSALHDACVEYVSCLPPSQENPATVSSCAWEQQDQSDTITLGSIPPFYTVSLACLRAANGKCDAVTKCVTGAEGSCDPRAQRGRTCDGAKIVFCDAAGRRNARDCAAGVELGVDPGASCMTTSDQRAVCGFASCDPTKPASCEEGVAVTCDQGVLQRETCKAPARCEASGSLARCVEPGEETTCAITDKPRCDGNDLVACNEAGRETRYHCAANATCGSDCEAEKLRFPQYPCDDAVFCRPSPKLACDPLAHLDRCDGTRLVFCDGSERSIDCAALGFSRCETFDKGARCR